MQRGVADTRAAGSMGLNGPRWDISCWRSQGQLM